MYVSLLVTWTKISSFQVTPVVSEFLCKYMQYNTPLVINITL